MLCEQSVRVHTWRCQHILVLIEGSITYTFCVSATSEAEDAVARARLGKAIRDRRTDPRLAFKTRDDFAKRVGVHGVTIGYIEHGRRPIRATTARKIEAALHWKPGACDEILTNPDANATTYAEDPPTPTAISAAMARSMLNTARTLQAQLPENPALAGPLDQMLADSETKLTQLAEHEFSHDILRVLIDIGTLRQNIAATINPQG